MYWFFTALVAAIVITIALVAIGRGEAMARAYPDRRFVDLPEDRALVAADLNALRLDLGLRGYRMDEVDDLLDRLADEIAARDDYIGELERELSARHTAVPAESTNPPERA